VGGVADSLGYRLPAGVRLERGRLTGEFAGGVLQPAGLGKMVAEVGTTVVAPIGADRLAHQGR
jgi:hypothetical protein